MKLPRDLSGDEVVKGLRRVGYESTRQTGDHVYMTTHNNGEHHVSVPLHNPIKVGTLSTILGAVAAHLRMSRDQLLRAMKV
jgi:predicted RNA binding protein YcfA (HicA-like mRNA interferase family)